MALTSYALTTLVNAKLALGIVTADTSKDTLIEQSIDRATLEIEGLTERKLKARNYNGFNASGEGSDFEHKTTSTGDTVPSEDYLFFTNRDTHRDEEGRGIYYLPQYPVLKVNSTARNVICHPSALTFRLQYLADRGSDVSGYETWTSLTEWDDYLIEHEQGVIRLLGTSFGGFTSAVRNYRVKCTAGYIGPTANTQPYVPPNLEQLCIAMMKKLFRDDYGLQSESLGTWSRSYNPEQAEKAIEKNLALFRRHSL